MIDCSSTCCRTMKKDMKGSNKRVASGRDELHMALKIDFTQLNPNPRNWYYLEGLDPAPKWEWALACIAST